MQDVLNLGGEARMNFPGKLGGNWSWRMKWEQVQSNLPHAYKQMAELYERPPKPQKEEEIEVHDK
jgi:4-alpha-glucanotransferase